MPSSEAVIVGSATDSSSSSSAITRSSRSPHLWLKMNCYPLMGLIAGSTADPPALAYANATAGNDMPAVGCSTVYPVVMFLRVLTAQIYHPVRIVNPINAESQHGKRSNDRPFAPTGRHWRVLFSRRLREIAEWKPPQVAESSNWRWAAPICRPIRRSSDGWRRKQNVPTFTNTCPTRANRSCARLFADGTGMVPHGTRFRIGSAAAHRLERGHHASA